MKKLLIILGVAGLLSGCDMMTAPADGTMADDAAMATSAADDMSGTHTNTNSQDQNRDRTSN